MRADGRRADQLRPITFQRDFTTMAAGSVLVTFGGTHVLCTASVDEDVPRWMRGTGKGWVTAEYSMLPGASPERIRREVKDGKPSGRTQEIQRLIGRALRAVTDMRLLGERQILLDCDVLQADGGTRTASICGAWVALHDACSRLVADGRLAQNPVVDACGAISVGIIDGQPRLDLPYEEDSRAEVDMNVVMTGSGGFVEVQGTAEGAPYSRTELDALLLLAEAGISSIVEMQREVVSTPPTPR
ncbi:MAG: ribonuclease PH [Acidimicrobiia bacterium]|nr:ribonuclease PH [Acidimicrobiia bacterium]